MAEIESDSRPYFDGTKLTFVFDGLDIADESDAQSTVAAFLALGPADRVAAGRYVFAHYRDIAARIDADDLACQIASEREVWEHVRPTEIYVSRRHRHERAIYVQITAECEWEPEHGLQLVYRAGNKLTRVSDQDGHLTHTDAYDLPETEDKIVEEPSGGSQSAATERKPWWKLW